jgi:hypothetical protein
VPGAVPAPNGDLCDTVSQWQNALNSHFRAHWEQMLTFRGNGKWVPAGKSLTMGGCWPVLARAVARCDSRPPLIYAVTLTRNFCDGEGNIKTFYL